MSQMNYSYLFKRASAYLVDNIILFIVFTLLHFMVFGTWARHIDQINLSFATHPVCLAFLFVYFSYFILSEGIRGFTIGKKIFDLKVEKLNGKSCDIRDSFIRNVFRLIDGLIFYLVGLIFIIKSPEKQRLGDKIAGTVVKYNRRYRK